MRESSPAEGRRRLPARAAAGLVSVLGRPAERIAGPAGFLARRNAMRNPGRTAAMAAALAIGVTLVTGVATLAAALEQATSGEAKRAIGTNLVLSDSQWLTVDASAAERIAKAPGVRTVAPMRQARAKAFGGEISVDGIEPRASAAIVDYRWSVGSKATMAALHGNQALVGDDFAEQHHLRVGSPLEIRTANGRPLALSVAGVIERPGINPVSIGDVTIARDTYARSFPSRQLIGAYVDAPGVSPATLQKQLTGYPGVEVRTAGEFADHAAGVFKIVLAIFNVLLGLAVIVSVFGIVNTLVLSVLERTRELGLLRAAGMSRRQMRRMVRQESIITALVGAAIGIVAGLALGALATSLLPVPGLAVAIPVGTIVTVVAVAVVLGILAALVPARRAARMDVLAAVSYA
jgi:putative ABC transport system permease protein